MIWEQGTGLYRYCCLKRRRDVILLGLEIQPEMAEMARRSVDYNGLEDKVDIVTGDIKEAAEYLSRPFLM